MTNREYFEKLFPEKIQELKEDTIPMWGSMTASDMLDHLRKGLVISMENTDDEITTPEERLPSYKAFLMSDRPFGQNLNAPAVFFSYPASEDNFEKRRQTLLETLKYTRQFMAENPDHRAIHPSFGQLNAEEWWQLHRKHFTHHLAQFGISS